jgi:plastocyanin
MLMPVPVWVPLAFSELKLREDHVRKLMAVVAVFVLALAACNSDEPTVDDVAGSPDATEGAEESPEAMEDHGTKTFTDDNFELEMELDDFYFEPTTVKAPGGSTAKIMLVNEGEQPHTFTIDSLDVDEELEPDARKEITVELGTDSKTDFYCRFHSESNDMKGSFSLH